MDKCREHNDLKKNLIQLKGRLTFMEHCIQTEREQDFPTLTNEATLVSYRKDYDDLVSLVEHTAGSKVKDSPDMFQLKKCAT
ncbi:hypothetical protein TNIN_139161 [Trichonephila inaurata madagascariensis]|uniref:Uncharacterized protein n=1 Tax=Trichonephila inaurata madagascariensis TaxID=2747483 RepID=A0A8X6MDT6_9ARAC|nr:hypothetical protein TNIN_139161 [Trichonephila inaurata madagascariensis]